MLVCLEPLQTGACCVVSGTRRLLSPPRNGFLSFASDAVAVCRGGFTEPEWVVVVALHGAPLYTGSPSIQMNKPKGENRLILQCCMALCCLIHSPHMRTPCFLDIQYVSKHLFFHTKGAMETGIPLVPSSTGRLL